ncbi:hypothetical protein AZI87_00790 [Bdellovibrio bacteriovorus]|uniref:Uncharacterized protein n=1 Tax=Bdellovibrio bacteriovorus TaxID=959 RepID=A0A162GD48_BDEBC|nr:hypothetical protein [Bdellovibrio bacteriovorus]KYG67850.1 hypothetical protein AZI87_00790 [Bdellovibrio bacteriovorus]
MTATLRNFELWLLKFLTFFGGCFFCFYLQSHFKWTPVVAASLTGLLGTFIPDTKRIEGAHIHALVYTGAFVAMGSRVVDAGLWQILLVSVVGSTIYFCLGARFKGLGGRLGFIAFVSSLLGIALRYWL